MGIVLWGLVRWRCARTPGEEACAEKRCHQHSRHGVWTTEPEWLAQDQGCPHSRNACAIRPMDPTLTLATAGTIGVTPYSFKNLATDDDRLDRRRSPEAEDGRLPQGPREDRFR